MTCRTHASTLGGLAEPSPLPLPLPPPPPATATTTAPAATCAWDNRRSWTADLVGGGTDDGQCGALSGAAADFMLSARSRFTTAAATGVVVAAAAAAAAATC